MAGDSARRAWPRATCALLLLATMAQGAAAMGRPGIDTTDLPEGTVTITGVHAGPGVTCPQFTTEDGERISLSGAHGAAEAGRGATLAGTWQRRTKCMQGREFRVLRELGD